jgi:hypothetical protein
MVTDAFPPAAQQMCRLHVWESRMYDWCVQMYYKNTIQQERHNDPIFYTYSP